MIHSTNANLFCRYSSLEQEDSIPFDSSFFCTRTYGTYVLYHLRTYLYLPPPLSNLHLEPAKQPGQASAGPYSVILITPWTHFTVKTYDHTLQLYIYCIFIFTHTNTYERNKLYNINFSSVQNKKTIVVVTTQ
jgi:hypothetical protein